MAMPKSFQMSTLLLAAAVAFLFGCIATFTVMFNNQSVYKKDTADEITKLKAENAQLAIENKSIKEEKQKVTGDYSDLKNKYTATSSNLDMCRDTADSLKQKLARAEQARINKSKKGRLAKNTGTQKADTSAVASGMPFLWHDPYATEASPKPCIVSDGNGEGLPPYCTSFSVKPAKVRETKKAWLVRVGGGHNPTDTGLYHKVQVVAEAQPVDQEQK